MPGPTNLPCPFCGSTNIYHRYTVMGNAVACRNCQTIGPEARSLESQDAMDLWNRRTLGRAEPPPTSKDTDDP